jgi:hypothetical protein
MCTVCVLLRHTKSSSEVQPPQCSLCRGLGLGVSQRCRKNRQKVKPVRDDGDVGIRVFCQVNWGSDKLQVKFEKCKIGGEIIR